MEKKYPSVTLPLMEAIEAASAVLPHVSKDDVTPTLVHANLQDDRLIGTDRYTVGTFRLSSSVDGEFMVPRGALEWLARVNPKTLVAHYQGSPMSGYQVRITGPKPGPSGPALVDEAVQVEVLYDGKPERMQRFKPFVGSFPDVANRLLDKHESAVEVSAIKLNPEFVERVTTYARKWHRREPVKFLVGKSDNPKRPGVVRVSIGKFDGLIQPNLLGE